MSERPFMEEWTEVISPANNLLDLRLNEVWRYRDLILLFVKRDLIAQYKQTVLGPVWNVVQPVLTTLMFLILFNKIANIKTDPLPPVLFYISSITIWNYFSTCFTATSTTFVTNAGIFGKVYFPRLALPLSVVISNMARFGIQFGLVLVVMIYYAIVRRFPIELGWHMLLIPVITVIMAAMGLGLGIIISSLTTKYRDFTILVNFGVQLLMYVTPVAYPLLYLAQKRHELYNFIKWNPLSPLIEGFRYALFGTGIFSWRYFLYSIVVAFICLIIGVVLFNKVERTFMDTV